jgi:hypothetical protein
MKLFIKRLLLFFAVSFCLSLFLYILLDFFNKRALETYKLKASVKNVFIGDSHVQLAINDRILTNSVNISENSESSLFSYFKIKTILSNNPFVKRIYLGFGYHSISDYYDDYTYGKYSNNVAPRYFFILPLELKIFMLKKNFPDFVTFLRNISLNGLKIFLNKRPSFIGNYENGFKSSSSRIESMEKRINAQFYEKDSLKGFSYMNLVYLNKIIDLCKKMNVELIILNTPLDSYYKKRIPSKFIQKYYSIIRINDLKIIDFGYLKLNNSYFIPDGDHVSEKGAVLITKTINELK